MVRIILTLKLSPPTEDQLLALRLFRGNIKILFRYEIDVKGQPVWTDCLSDARRLIELMVNRDEDHQAEEHFGLSTRTGEKVKIDE